MAHTIPTQAEFEQRILQELEHRKSIDGINAMLALEYVDCSAEGRWVQLCHKVKPEELNVNSSMHGGMIVSVLDASMGVLCRCFTGEKKTLTLDIHVNFLRPIFAGETVYSRAEMQHISQHVIRLKVEAWTKDPGKLCATGDAVFYRGDQK